MKTTALHIFAVLAIVASPAFASKNIYDVRFGSLPADCESLLKTDAASWDFGFRPYGAGSSQLWTDPIVARGALDGSVDSAAQGPRPTAIRVSCDTDSFSVLVLCVEPTIASAISSTNSLPSPSVEMYFAPGDTDNHDPEPYFQFYYGDGVLRHFQWQVQDHTWRDISSSVFVDERRLPNGFLLRLTFPWERLFDRLPFSSKADAIWRLSVIRWVDGGRTWGGVVHQESRAGYIRFPDFSTEERVRIMKRLLEKGWMSFRRACNDPQYNVSGGWAAPIARSDAFILEENAKMRRTFINYSEDPDFRPELEKLVAERNALADGIAGFESKTPAEQLAFYRKASDMLFNFRYFVEEAYGRHLGEKLFK